MHGAHVRIAVVLALTLYAVPVLAQLRPPRGEMRGGPATQNADGLLQRAQRTIGVRVQQATQSGARTERTQDGRSFVLVWKPAGTPAGWIVTLHGSDGWAYEELFHWQPFARPRGLGVIALQWWFGGGSLPHDYYTPPDIRRELERVMLAAGASRERVVLHGFSRGAANLPSPYQGTRWWLWCGGRDPRPDLSGCPGMRRTRGWVERFGGRVELAEDPAGGHGGFHRGAANVEAALDYFFPRRLR